MKNNEILTINSTENNEKNNKMKLSDIYIEIILKVKIKLKKFIQLEKKYKK